jgi:hypothetical protein
MNPLPYSMEMSMEPENAAPNDDSIDCNIDPVCARAQRFGPKVVNVLTSILIYPKIRAVVGGDAVVVLVDPTHVHTSSSGEEIIAGPKVQVGVLFWVSVNFTGITPLFAENTLLPSVLIGCCTNAL